MTDPKIVENRQILIIVESSNSLGVLPDYLKGFGYKITTTNNGETALTTAEYIIPDIILLDVKLSGMDGFETCRQLKANKVTREIPIIFITAQTSTVDKLRGFALGAVDYITRPIQSEEVLARLRTHLTIQHLRKQLQEQNIHLQEEIAEREKLIEELDAFAHTVAHDLKNPLGATISYAQFLKKYCTSMSVEELQKYADNVMRNGQKMGNIIDELLLLASVRKEEIALTPVDLGDVVIEAQSRLTHLIEEYQAEIVMPDDWPETWGYGPWIEEVLTNYLSNAIKYGGRPPRVEVGATPYTDGTVLCWVRDNGLGLTAEQRARLFIPFTRLNQVSAKGHGLGLSIVQRIVEKLGGQVAVESEGHGRGSVFSFTLPPINGSLGR
jgi:signal transduction histidine kinase